MRLLPVAASLALLGASIEKAAASEVFAIQLDPSQAYAIGGEIGLLLGPSPLGIAAFPGASTRRGGGSSGPAPAAARPVGATAAPSVSGAKPAPSSPATENLSRRVLLEARSVGKAINSTGGYRFDGVNDCYGFLRRAWNGILASLKQRPLPVSDYVSSAWRPIHDWDALKPGDLLATHQGHMWGARWHAGLYVGKVGDRHMIYDNSGRSSRGGAYIRPLPPGLFHYYYGRTHQLLVAAAEAPLRIPAP